MSNKKFLHALGGGNQGEEFLGNGIVDGTASNDDIDLAYTGDPEGDMIDAGDAILPGQSPNDDIVDALGGDDTISSGQGDDTVFAGSGSDFVYGGSGNDVIWGDSTAPGIDGTSTDGNVSIRESFEWDLAPDPNGPGLIGNSDDLSGGFTQNTGSVDVTYSVLHESAGVDTEFDTDVQHVSGIDTGNDFADEKSALKSVLNGVCNNAEYQLEFSETVTDVSFRINDIDGDGVVRVQAFDAEGNIIAVDMSGGAHLVVSDEDFAPGADTADSNGGYQVTDNPGYSVLVTIPGPMASLVISHHQDGNHNTGVNVTDVYFDAPLTNVATTGEDDVLFGGSGEDVIYGQGGDDTISGGTGDDVIHGGDGSDVLLGGMGDDAISLGADSFGDIAFGGLNSDTFSGIGQGDIVDGGEDPDGSDFDILDLTNAAETANPGGSLSVDYGPINPENGVVRFTDASGNETGTSRFYNIEEVIMPCFTPGTLIATPRGEMLVEDLQIGDRVITRDNGIQDIRWIGARALTCAELANAAHLNPILIRQGALGNGLPERDLMVSPNHRVLVANDKTALYFEDREVLVAAKHLTGLDGIDRVEVSDVTYIHFMFAQHEVVLSDGAWTESFQPGDLSLKGIGNAQRTELLELFPEMKTSEGIAAYSCARRSLKKHEARLLM